MWAARLLPWVFRMMGTPRLLSLQLSLRLRTLTLEVGAEFKLADCALRGLLGMLFTWRNFATTKVGSGFEVPALHSAGGALTCILAQQGKVCSCRGTIWCMMNGSMWWQCGFKMLDNMGSCATAAMPQRSCKTNDICMGWQHTLECSIPKN